MLLILQHKKRATFLNIIKNGVYVIIVYKKQLYNRMPVKTYLISFLFLHLRNQFVDIFNLKAYNVTTLINTKLFLESRNNINFT